jgi:hypothetical protein
MRTPPIPTPPKNIRLTITVTPEVHDAFERLAKAGSMSLGRAMGEWLGDTVDAAQFMAETMEKARAAPRLVAQELHAYALGLGDETGALIERLREKGAAERSSGAPARRTRTPPSNTGVTNAKNNPQRGQSAT